MEFSKFAGYKESIYKKQLHFYTLTNYSKEIKNTMPFTIASKRKNT